MPASNYIIKYTRLFSKNPKHKVGLEGEFKVTYEGQVELPGIHPVYRHSPI
jgi:hypothetical protein